MEATFQSSHASTGEALEKDLIKPLYQYVSARKIECVFLQKSFFCVQTRDAKYASVFGRGDASKKFKFSSMSVICCVCKLCHTTSSS
jgi:hypothetical protein